MSANKNQAKHLYTEMLELTGDKHSAAIMAAATLLAIRLDALGYDHEERSAGIGIGEKIAVELEDLQKAVESVSMAIDMLGDSLRER